MPIRITLIAILIFFSTVCQSQIIIALLFGDKLNSDKVKFGLDIGASYSSIKSYDPDYSRGSLNLGMFFEFKLNERLILNPRLYFISESGGNKLPYYSLNDSILDPALSNTAVQRRLRYFSLPVLLKVNLFNHLYFDVGPQLSFLTRADDSFYESTEKGNIIFETNVRNSINHWDFGVKAGFSYKLFKGKGMSINANYYQGMMPIYTNSGAPTEYNQVIQLGVSVSIGTKSHKQLDEATE
ncbi:MAG: hypothetical protein CL840_16465 [Crocinitomicaceae bacterium]|nr:hypothetical protein [Crocinitomicaceae bacterium]|tara:strand:+ start:7249 stop:7968 length:720 start_codon:yes stop_codon:yes gene_type:complete